LEIMQQNPKITLQELRAKAISDNIFENEENAPTLAQFTERCGLWGTNGSEREWTTQGHCGAQSNTNGAVLSRHSGGVKQAQNR
jgi:glucuronate isomerase